MFVRPKSHTRLHLSPLYLYIILVRCALLLCVFIIIFFCRERQMRSYFSVSRFQGEDVVGTAALNNYPQSVELHPGGDLGLGNMCVSPRE
jgi:hypothetical protein